MKRFTACRTRLLSEGLAAYRLFLPDGLAREGEPSQLPPMARLTT